MLDERIRALDELEFLMTYWPEGAERPRPPDASGYTFRDLYRAGLLPDTLVDLLVQVVDRMRTTRRVTDDPLLMEAWLYAFEIRASAHPEQVDEPRQRA